MNMMFFSVKSVVNAVSVVVAATATDADADATLFSFGRSICPRFASLYILIIRDYHLSAFIVPFTVCETDETKQRFKIKVYCTLREHCSYCLSFSFIYGRALTMCAEVISFNLCNQRGHIIIIIVIYPTFFLSLILNFFFLLLQELWPALTVIRGSRIDHLDFFIFSCSRTNSHSNTIDSMRRNKVRLPFGKQ